MRDEIKGRLHRNRICFNVARVVESDLKKNSPEYYVILFNPGRIISQHFQLSQPPAGIMECAIVQDG